MRVLLWATYGDEEVRDLLLVLLPGGPVLFTAAGNVTRCAMNDHAGEENRIEPRERAPGDAMGKG